jgi:hypothetical protein
MWIQRTPLRRLCEHRGPCRLPLPGPEHRTTFTSAAQQSNNCYTTSQQRDVAPVTKVQLAAAEKRFQCQPPLTLFESTGYHPPCGSAQQAEYRVGCHHLGERRRTDFPVERGRRRRSRGSGRQWTRNASRWALAVRRVKAERVGSAARLPVSNVRHLLSRGALSARGDGRHERRDTGEF